MMIVLTACIVCLTRKLLLKELRHYKNQDDGKNDTKDLVFFKVFHLKEGADDDGIAKDHDKCRQKPMEI